MSQFTSLYWLRHDLRVSDNQALTAAMKAGPAIALYILDDNTQGDNKWPLGGASRWWLHHSLTALAASLHKMGVPLILRRGDPVKLVPQIAKQLAVQHVHANRLYQQPLIARDEAIAETLTANEITWYDYDGSYLHEPTAVKPKSSDYYKVYTPFSRTVMQLDIAPALRVPKAQEAHRLPIDSDDLHDWKLLPYKPDWSTGFKDWQPGERGAHNRLHALIDTHMHHYRDGRDRPDKPLTSHLSPHLAFGEIGPRQIWHAVQASGELDANRETFLKELVWREFAMHTLYHQPHLPDKPLDERFTHYPWSQSDKNLHAWQHGQTGYPIVDAGMRQLWETGWMHNRVRMIVASFLIKHLLIRWQDGERWFWDTLVDADLAQNAFNWQWVAGSGADAAPYFRIFNPMLQGKKFDPDGTYVRRFVPELKNMPARFIHAPWEASDTILQAAGVTLGKTYPRPIVDHDAARTRAMAGFKSIQKSDELALQPGGIGT